MKVVNKLKKLKELWNRNRVLFVLATIVIVCFIIILIVTMKLFFGVSTSAYGDRLESISSSPVTDEQKNAITSKLKENDSVSDVEVHTQGKIIYIRITYKGVSLNRAKEIAVTAMDTIKEEYQKLYDVHFTLKQTGDENSETFTVMGAKNINGKEVIWNNNTTFTSEADEE